MEPVNRTSDNLRGLLSDLDDKLANSRPLATQDDVIAGPPTRTLPTWVALIAVTALGIGISVIAVRPWVDRCEYVREVCQVAQLDIDALRITIPDSELIATLPNIDALDPDDVLTAGDIFAMERFSHLNFEELLTAEDIDRLLGVRAG